MAGTTCTQCHGQPPFSIATAAAAYVDQQPFYNEGRTPHPRHARARPNGYGIDCRVCHFQGTSGLTHDTAPGTFRSVWFDPAWNPAAAAFNPADPLPQTTPDYAWDTGANGSRCSQIYFHSNGASTAAVGSAVWMTNITEPDYSISDLACDACHGDGDGDGAGRNYPDDPAGNHAQHVGGAIRTRCLTGGDDHANRVSTAWIRVEDWDGDGQSYARLRSVNAFPAQ